MGDLKSSKQAVGASLLTEAPTSHPRRSPPRRPALQSRQRFFNLVVTNVPGPQFPLYLLGRELQDVFPMVPLAENQSVCFGIMSYNGRVNFGITADYDAMPELEALADDTRAAIDELSAAIGSEGGRRASRRVGGPRSIRPSRRSEAAAPRRRSSRERGPASSGQRERATPRRSPASTTRASPNARRPSRPRRCGNPKSPPASSEPWSWWPSETGG